MDQFDSIGHLYGTLAIGLVSLFGIAAASQSAWCHNEVRLGRMLIVYDIAELPKVPRRSSRSKLDKNRSTLREKMIQVSTRMPRFTITSTRFASKLLATSEQKPLFPIEVRVSSVPINSTEAIPGTTVHECCDQAAHFLTFVLHPVEQRARNRMMCFAPRDQPVFDLQVPFGPTIADWTYCEKIAPMLRPDIRVRFPCVP
jgi:hypothetical protein